jgi:choline monooxygenase
MKLSSYLKDRTIANGLPAMAYTDEEFWIKECETVFADNWVFVGFAHELKNLGDVLPISVAGKPILLVKNRNGNIVAFHNVCRHRCLKLVDRPKNDNPLSLSFLDL